MAGEKIKNLVFRRAAGFFIRRKALLIKGKIQKQENHQHQSSENQNIGVYSPKINIVHSSIVSSNLTVISKKIIAIIKSYDNIQRAPDLLRPAKLGTINTVPKKPAARLIVNPDNVLNHAFDDFISFNLANDYLFVKQRIYC